MNASSQFFIKLAAYYLLGGALNPFVRRPAHPLTEERERDTMEVDAPSELLPKPFIPQIVGREHYTHIRLYNTKDPRTARFGFFTVDPIRRNCDGEPDPDQVIPEAQGLPDEEAGRDQRVENEEEQPWFLFDKLFEEAATVERPVGDEGEPSEQRGDRAAVEDTVPDRSVAGEGGSSDQPTVREIVPEATVQDIVPEAPPGDEGEPPEQHNDTQPGQSPVEDTAPEASPGNAGGPSPTDAPVHPSPAEDGSSASTDVVMEDILPKERIVDLRPMRIASNPIDRSAPGGEGTKEMASIYPNDDEERAIAAREAAEYLELKREVAARHPVFCLNIPVTREETKAVQRLLRKQKRKDPYRHPMPKYVEVDDNGRFMGLPWFYLDQKRFERHPRHGYQYKKRLDCQTPIEGPSFPLFEPVTDSDSDDEEEVPSHAKPVAILFPEKPEEKRKETRTERDRRLLLLPPYAPLPKLTEPKPDKSMTVMDDDYGLDYEDRRPGLTARVEQMVREKYQGVRRGRGEEEERDFRFRDVDPGLSGDRKRRRLNNGRRYSTTTERIREGIWKGTKAILRFLCSKMSDY